MEKESETKVLSVNEKLDNLEKRVVALEKIEHRRKIKNIIIFCIYMVFFIGVVIGGFILYNKFKPYVDKIDSMNEIIDKNNLGEYTDLFNDLFK